MKSIYDLNYDSVIAIGNDSPHLTAKQLKKSTPKQ
jgi:hypothetical protein